MNVIAGDFRELGYAIVANDALQSLIKDIRAKFERHFIPRFGDDTTRNRNIIKLLAEDVDVKRFFCSPDLTAALDRHLGIAMPVQTGPIVTHYTANNSIGNNYGLPYHQDWPSMGTSSRAVIAWTSIADVRKGAPGLSIVPGSHLRGLWPGKQTDRGYVLDDQAIDGACDLEIDAGHVLFMSPYLVHRTLTSDVTDWKLSLSCRFDDFSCDQWSRRGFVSAYRTAVDRQVYLSGF
ncbi:phytanoyl-CoA dioxygenase family protein [Burkholderia cepacia]|uniref:phytanoyl-CoA dioxygenase family protein n=1 Tax=Burkholderia cepacia TaxID=292 RepID=UPI001867E9A7|nr:phytanoyl-CoA dioxygenase family protein [Burkholderia cepacia]MBE2971062.1 phytanoyl-CoA dioxygenase family protein [Burkholderia cepacia]